MGFFRFLISPTFLLYFSFDFSIASFRMCTLAAPPRCRSPSQGTTTLFHLHLAAWSLSHCCKCCLPFLYWGFTLFTTPALLSSSRSWWSRISVADLPLWAVSDPLLHHPLLPVQANTFLPSLELQGNALHIVAPLSCCARNSPLSLRALHTGVSAPHSD